MEHFYVKFDDPICSCSGVCDIVRKTDRQTHRQTNAHHRDVRRHGYNNTFQMTRSLPKSQFNFCIVKTFYFYHTLCTVCPLMSTSGTDHSELKITEPR